MNLPQENVDPSLNILAAKSAIKTSRRAHLLPATEPILPHARSPTFKPN
jgi:hypothetical protein